MKYLNKITKFKLILILMFLLCLIQPTSSVFITCTTEYNVSQVPANYLDLLHKYKYNDSHVELANQSNYDISIACHSGVTTLTNDCMSNVYVNVTTLFNVTNSHVSQNMDYDFQVCLGTNDPDATMSIRNETAGYSLQSNETCLYSVYNMHDSHVAECGEANYDIIVSLEVPSTIYCYNCTDCNRKINTMEYRTVIIHPSVASITNLTGNCIEMGKNNVVFDCNNSAVIGPGTSTYDAFRLNNLENVTIKNCNITNWRYGIHFTTGVSDSLFDNNIISTVDRGITRTTGVSYSRNLFNDLTIFDAVNGIFLSYVDYNNFTNNNLYDISHLGLYLSNSDYNQVINNSIISTRDSLQILASSNFNNITENNLTCLSSSTYYDISISLSTSNNNNIWKNRFGKRGVFQHSSGNNNYCVNGIGNYYAASSGFNRFNADCGPHSTVNEYYVNPHSNQNVEWGETDENNINYVSLAEAVANANPALGVKIIVTNQTEFYAEEVYIRNHGNLSIDCNNSLLRGDNSVNGDGIGLGDGLNKGFEIDNADNIIIENCRFKDYSWAIDMYGSTSNVNLKNVEVRVNPNRQGIRSFGSGAGITNNNITISNSKLYSEDSSSKFGVSGYYTEGFYVLNNNITSLSNSDSAIYIGSYSVNVNISYNNVTNYGTTYPIDVTSTGVSGVNIHFNNFNRNARSAAAVANINWNISTGGNYWEMYSKPEHGCYDIDGDLFCDDPLLIEGTGNNYDYLPRICPYGGNCPPSRVELISPTNYNYTVINKSTEFRWHDAIDPDGDEVTYDILVECYKNGVACSPSDDRSKTDISGNSTFFDEPFKYFYDDGYYYNWTVTAKDSEGNYGAESEEWTFGIMSYVSIWFERESVDFGTMMINEYNDTTNNNPLPLILTNVGNCPVNVNMTGTRLFSSGDWPSDNFRFKIDELAGYSGAYNASTITSFTNVPEQNMTIIYEFNDTSMKNKLEVDIAINVPSDEPGGDKSSIITFTGFRA